MSVATALPDLTDLAGVRVVRASGGDDTARLQAACAAAPVGSTLLVIGPVRVNQPVTLRGLTLRGRHLHPMKGLPVDAGGLTALPAGDAVLLSGSGQIILDDGACVAGLQFHRLGQNYAATTAAGVLTSPAAIKKRVGKVVSCIGVFYCSFTGFTTCIDLLGTNRFSDYSVADWTRDVWVYGNYGYPLGTGAFLRLHYCLETPVIARNLVSCGNGYYLNDDPDLSVSWGLVDDLIAAGNIGFDFNECDQLTATENFVFGTGVGFRARAGQIYGTLTGCRTDMVPRPYWCSHGGTHEIKLIDAKGFVGAGSPTTRQLVRLDGDGGYTVVRAARGTTGVCPTLPSSVADTTANALVAVVGSNAQRVFLDDATYSAVQSGGGAWTYPLLRRDNAASTVTRAATTTLTTSS